MYKAIQISSMTETETKGDAQTLTHFTFFDLSNFWVAPGQKSSSRFSYPNPQTQTDTSHPLLYDDTRTENSLCCPGRKTIQGRRFSWTEFSLRAAVNKTETGITTEQLCGYAQFHTFLSHLCFWILWDFTLKNPNQATQSDAIIQLLHEAFSYHLLTCKTRYLCISMLSTWEWWCKWPCYENMDYS